MLLQTEEWQGREAVEEQMSTHALHMTLVERVIQMMHVYVAESLSLEDMADIACLSPYYFNRIFHQHIGIPPGEFFATLRLHVAKRLLLTTEASITEICFSVGYSGLGSFTTRFTQLVGLSPVGYATWPATSRSLCLLYRGALPIWRDCNYRLPGVSADRFVLKSLRRETFLWAFFPSQFPRGGPSPVRF